MVIAIMLSAFVIVDGIMFVNGYKSYFFQTKTKQEKDLRRAFFKRRNIKWDEKT
jgi:hypothetical protein